MSRRQAGREWRWLLNDVVLQHQQKPKFKVGEPVFCLSHQKFARILKANNRDGWGRTGMREGFSYTLRFLEGDLPTGEAMEDQIRRLIGDEPAKVTLMEVLGG